MKIAVANRAEETQACFTSSKLLPENQFLRTPKAWNYLKQKKRGKKKSSLHVVWKCYFRKNWVVSLGLNLFSTCQRQQRTHYLGSKLTSEESFNGSDHPSEAGQRQAGWRTGHQKHTALILLPALDQPCFLDGLESKVCYLMVPHHSENFKNCCFTDIHLGSTGQNFFTNSES